MDAAAEFSRLSAQYGTVDPTPEMPGTFDREVPATLYRRNEDGTLTRVGQEGGITVGRLGDYTHREKLLGWPETEVYWYRATGACLGYAPRSV